MNKLRPPKAATTTPEPYELIKSFENNMTIFTTLGFTETSRIGKGVYLQHPESNNAASVLVFFDSAGGSGIFSLLTNRLEPLEAGGNYTTIHLIEKVLEQKPMTYGRKMGWLESEDDTAQKVAKQLSGEVEEAVEWELTDMAEDLTEYDHSQKPIPILGNWLRPANTTFLFGREGIGKSILALEAAIAIAEGVDFTPFKLFQKGNVIYLNMESSKDNIMDRLALNGLKRQIPKGVFSSYAGDGWSQGSEDFEYYLKQAVESVSDLRLVVLDNISYVIDNVSEPEAAGIFIKSMKNIVLGTGAALLIVNHITKQDESYTMDINHMQGGSKLKQLGDYVVGVFESQTEPDTILFREFKVKYGRKEYIGARLPKFKRVFEDWLTLQFVGYDAEENHRKTRSNLKNKDAVRDYKIEIAIHLSNRGNSAQEIADILMVSKRTIVRFLGGAKISKPRR